MKEEKGNLFTVFDELLNRPAKEQLLKQRSIVLWMTGLSGSGKTTIAKGLERFLYARGYLTQILDGDNVRTGINNDLGFSKADRKENIRRIAEVSKLFLHCGVITIDCFVSPTREIRSMAKEIIGKEDFIEIFIDAPLSICEERDPKGLYRKARSGKISTFTGIDAPYEPPECPDVTINTAELSIEESVLKIYNFISPKIQAEK